MVAFFLDIIHLKKNTSSREYSITRTTEIKS